MRDQSIPKQLFEQLLQRFFTELTSQLELNPKKKFGFCGVQMFTLDMQFLLGCTDQYINEDTNILANAIVGKVLKMFFMQNKDQAANSLKPGEWYDKRVKESVNKNKKALAILFKR